MPSYYGTNVTDTTLTSACGSSSVSGGTETTTATDMNGGNDYGEITSHFLNPNADMTAIPTTPTGKGWVFNKPGAGTYSAGNWSAALALSSTAGDTVTLTFRAFRYSGGTYTLIGSINSSSFALPTSRTVITFSATSFSAITFGASDLLYFDFWCFDSTGAGADNPTIYVSNSLSAGVTNDVQVNAPTFTPAGPTLTNYTVTEQDPNELETISLLGLQTLIEQAPTYVETITAQSITLYPPIIEQAPTAQESVSILGIYIVSELTPPTAQESVSDATPYVVSELTPPTAQESVSLTLSLTISEQSPTSQESISLTQNGIVTEQTATSTETVTVRNIVPTISYTVNDVSFAIETVTVTNSIVITVHSYTVSELIPPTAQETVTIDPISQALPGAPMTQFDLEAQYSRIEASALVDRLQFCAITYYSSAGATKVLEGEIDGLLDGEDISMLHVMRTINDVNNFIYSYDYMASVLEDNPILYARMGDGAGGSAMDISGNGYNGSTFGGITTGQPGAVFGDPNSAMLFDGSSGYITFPTLLNTSSWSAISIELWFKIPALSSGYGRFVANDAPIGSHTNKGVELTLAPTTDGVTGYFNIGMGSSSSGIAFGSAPASASVWHHLTATWNNGVFLVYMDGQQIGSLTGASGLIVPGANGFNVGRDPVGGSSFYSGIMDELAIYPYALDPTRIAYRYQIGTGLAI